MCSINDDCVFKSEFGDVIGLAVCQDESCQCSVYFGFSGDNCTEFSDQLKAHRALEISAILLFSIIFCTSISLIIRIFPYWRTSAIVSEGLQKTLRNVLFVLIFVLFGAIANISESFLVIRTLFDPSRVEFNKSGRDIYVWTSPSRAYELLRVVSIVNLLLSVVLICISWIDLLEQLGEFCTVINHLSLILKVKRLLQKGLFLALVAMLALTIIPDTPLGLALLVSALLIIMVLVLLIVGRVYLVRSLKDFRSKATRKAVVMIARLSLRLTCCIIFAMGTMVLEAVESSRTKIGNNDDFDLIVFVSKLSVHFIFFYVELTLLFYSITISSTIICDLKKKEKIASSSRYRDQSVATTSIAY